MNIYKSFFLLAILFSIYSAKGQLYPSDYSPYQSIATPTTPAMPGYLESVVDNSVPKPIKITRVTAAYNYNDNNGNPQVWYPTHEYSKTQVWNADQTMYKIRSWKVYDATTHQEVQNIGNSSLYPCYWSNTDPDLIWSFKENGDIKKHFVSTNTTQNAGHITNASGNDYQYVKLGPGEGNIDKNDHYVALVGKDGQDMDVIVYDLQNSQVVTRKKFAGCWQNGGSSFPYYVDWVSVSQSGDYVVIMWDHDKTSQSNPYVENGQSHYGVEVYDRQNMQYQRRLVGYGNHGDLGYAVDGDEVLVQFYGTQGNGLYMYKLNGGGSTAIIQHADFGVDGHVSCRNLNRPGWAYITHADASQSGQLLAVKLDNTGTVEYFGHHFSSNTSYDQSPMACASPNGDIMCFRSDFGTGPNTDVVYSFFAQLNSNYTTYYVDQQNGSDTNFGTSVATAFQNFDVAKNAVQPGDTIAIVGTYHNTSYNPNYNYNNNPADAHLWHAENSIFINNLHGNSNEYITIKAYDDNTKILGDGSNIVRLRASSYIRIEGLNIEGEVERIPLSTAEAMQFVYIIDDGNMTGTTTNPDANDIHHRNLDETNDNDGIVEDSDTYTDISNKNVIRPSYTDTRGLYVTNCENIEIINNTIHHTPGGGLRVSDSKFVTISANEIYHCSARSYSGTHALVVTKTKPINNNNNCVTIERNLVHHNYNEIFSWSPKKTIITPRIDEGKGISLQRNNNNNWINGQGRILVANNICYWNGYSGIHSNDGYRIDFINNTCFMNSYTNTVTYANGTQSGKNIGISCQNGNDVRMINNISVVDTDWGGFALSASSNSSNLVVKNNLIYGINGTLAHDNDVNNQNGIEQDPLFVDAPATYNDENYAFDFKIYSISPAIDQGNTGNYVPADDYYKTQRDASPDIGAIERGAKCDNNNLTEWKMTNGTASWTNGTPNDTKPAVFSTSYIVNNNDLTACAMTINPGVTVTVDTDHFVKIKTDLTNNGTLEVKNQAALVMVEDDGIITGNGDYYIHKTTRPYASYDYTFWASPTASETISGPLVNSPQNHIYTYKTQNFLDMFDTGKPQTSGSPDGFDDNGDDWQAVAPTDEMIPGVGYIAMGEGSPFPFDPNAVTQTHTQSVVFTGKPNNGVIEISVYKDKYHTEGLSSADDAHTNSNLIGNPYPSAIDIKKLYNINNATTPILEGTFYYWTHDSSISSNNPGPGAYNFTPNDFATATYDGQNFVSVNGGSAGTTAPEYLASCQSFFVNVLDKGVIKFTNEMRVESPNNTFLRPQNDLDLIKLSLTNTAGDYRQIAVAFKDTGEDGFTHGQDGQRLINNINETDFYSIINNDERRFAIQTLSSFDDTKIVPLGIEISDDSVNHQINLDETQGVFANGQNVYLKDNLTNVIHNLTDSPYTFTASITDGDEDRFELVFINGTSSIDAEINKISMIDNGQGFYINSNSHENIDNIHIFNYLGQTLFAGETNKTAVFVPVNIKKNTLIFVRVQLNNGKIKTFKIVKK